MLAATRTVVVVVVVDAVVVVPVMVVVVVPVMVVVVIVVVVVVETVVVVSKHAGFLINALDCVLVLSSMYPVVRNCNVAANVNV